MDEQPKVRPGPSPDARGFVLGRAEATLSTVAADTLTAEVPTSGEAEDSNSQRV